MDYQPFIAAHRRKRADVTIAVRRVPLAEASRMGILALDENDRVTEWQEKPKQPEERPRLDGRVRLLEAGALRWLSEDRDRFRPRRHPGDARGRRPRLRLPLRRLLAGRRHDPVATGRPTSRCSRISRSSTCTTATGSIHTRSEERAPAKIGPTAQVHRSLISHGCVINGTVVNSVLSPGVRVDVGAVVRDSIVMFDSVIRSGRGRRPLDPRQGGRRRAGRDRRRRAGLRHAEPQEPTRLNTGITVVGKRAMIPRGARIGRNVKIAGDVKATDFATRVVKSGASVDSPRPVTAAARLAAANRRRQQRVAAGREHAGSGNGGRLARRLRPAPAGDATRVRVDGPHRPSRVDCPPCPGAESGVLVRPTDIERWLDELGLVPRAREDRDGVTSWDLRLDGRRRFDLPHHADPRPGVRADLLGPLRAADRRRVPQVVSASCCAGTTSTRS